MYKFVFKIIVSSSFSACLQYSFCGHGWCSGVVSCLALHLWMPGSNPTGGTMWIGFQSLLEFVCFLLNNSMGLSPTS